MDEKKLTLVHNAVDEEVKEPPKVSRVTNPIMKKLAYFHQEKIKFSVRDLFKA
jgi:hypothetical protein